MIQNPILPGFCPDPFSGSICRYRGHPDSKPNSGPVKTKRRPPKGRLFAFAPFKFRVNRRNRSPT